MVTPKKPTELRSGDNRLAPAATHCRLEGGLVILAFQTVDNPNWKWAVVFGIVALCILVMMARARVAAQRGHFFTRAELDGIVKRYLTLPGREQKTAALCCQLSDDFELHPLTNSECAIAGFNLKNKALIVVIKVYPAPGIPVDPLGKLKETVESHVGMPDQTPKAQILSSRVTDRRITKTVEVEAGQGPWGRFRHVAFYGPDCVCLIDFACPGATENMEALQPLIEAFLDNLHFTEESLGEPIDDSALSSIGTAYEGRPMVVRSPFPATDESGHLLCKTCGMPFEMIAESARDYYAVNVRRDQRLTLECPSCQALSVFLEAEVKTRDSVTA